MTHQRMFGPGIGLRIRMYVAPALNAVVLLALLAIAAVLFTVHDGWSFVVLFAMFALAGIAGGRRKRKGGRPDPHHVRRAGRGRFPLRRRAGRALSRLAVVADMPVPRVAVERDAVPLNWTTAPPGGTPRVHVTTGA